MNLAAAHVNIREYGEAERIYRDILRKRPGDLQAETNLKLISPYVDRLRDKGTP